MNITITENDKKKFDYFMMDNGGVMDSVNAIKYLYYCAEISLEQGLNGESDHEAVGEIVKDLMEMAQEVSDKSDIDYWKITECPMSASNINIIPMKEME